MAVAVVVPGFRVDLAGTAREWPAAGGEGSAGIFGCLDLDFVGCEPDVCYRCSSRIFRMDIAPVHSRRRRRQSYEVPQFSPG